VSESRDPGLALERTTLAWQRTGLSCAAAGAICLKVFWEAGVAGIVLSVLFVGIGGLAYAAGAATPTTPGRLRAMSLGLTAAAAIGAFLSIVG
jgi:uncharacterized membrane protein YidH (DUF202 family)